MLMANARSRALQVMRSMKSAIGIATGSMNIFMAILVEAWERPIKLAGPDWSQNSFCNKANTAQLLQNPIHSQICEAGVPLTRLARLSSRVCRCRSIICPLPALYSCYHRAPVSEEISGNGLDATLREFASGQKLFNRYRLIKTLGRGGMGVVWLARDEELERDVALKFLPDLIIRDRAVLGDLKRETRRSLELTHKNIVRIYDFVHDQTSGCISMEYVDGDTLSNLRADRPHKVFEADELKDWVSHLCDALDYAHNHARIVHRDLKPANLMVNQRGDLKVADFGIARSLSDSVSKLTMQQGKSGTLVYMSPQQLDGERGTHLDDVYSLGASPYELITSKPPFYSGNVDRQIRDKIPPPMTQRRKELEIEGEPIDEHWEEVVRACLAKNPERRPQSVSEVAKMLSVPSPKTRRAKRIRSQEHSKTWIALLAGTAAL